MQIIILAARTGWHTQQLGTACAQRGHEAVVLGWDALVASLGARGASGACGASAGVPPAAPRIHSGQIDLHAAHAVLARIIPNGSLEQIIYRVDALHTLEEAGVTVVNSARCIERTVDKFYTSALLQRAGLPTPDTVVCEQAGDAMAAFQAFGDVIVKPLFGSMGLGMVRVSDEDTAWRVFRAVDAIRGVYYVQRALVHDGRDVRAFVVGERVIGAIERSARGWRTNVSRGGAARAFALPNAWRDLALRAARAVGADYAGVDLLPAADGITYVLEVNGIPGWRGLHDATGVDAAGAIVEHLLRRCASGGLSRGAAAT